MNVVRLWNTLRWLRPVQIWGRLLLKFYRSGPDLRSAPEIRAADAQWLSCARSPSMKGPYSFRFLNVERSLQAPSDWNRIDWPKLWLYNLHYFDDLCATGAVERIVWHRSLVQRWIKENAPGHGNGWEPYPISLRIVNWTKWALMGNTLVDGARESLAVQVRWLRKRLEIHLLGNHLWANAKALVFAGAFFQGREAERWLEKGLSLLRRELDEQILADGGHFERSPMYHAIFLEDLIDLVQLATIFPETMPDRDVRSWRETVPRMFHWLRVMTHPDGEITFFNDAVMGIAPTCSDLIAYATALGFRVDEAPLGAIEPLPESGYVRMQAGPAVLIADVGPIGPDYLPGHAHADTLSFEFSLHRRRLLVNGGISTYEANEDRLRQRGTSEHNTVQVNESDSSEVWGGFRVARRARPLDVSWSEDEGGVLLEGVHNGYARLKSVGKTTRFWRLEPKRLLVTDRIEGKPKEAIARFRAHPSFTFHCQGDKCGTLSGAGMVLEWRAHNVEHVNIVPSSWHLGFGLSQPCQTLELRMHGNSLDMEFVWS